MPKRECMYILYLFLTIQKLRQKMQMKNILLIRRFQPEITLFLHFVQTVICTHGAIILMVNLVLD